MINFLNNNLLLILLILPFISIIIIFFIKNNKIIKIFSIFISFIIFIFSLNLWLFFNKSISNFQFLLKINYINDYNIHFYLGVDGISLFFLILTTFLISICLLISYEIIKNNIKEFFILFFILEFCLIISFSTLDIFIFYIFFESILIPMFLIIGFWGGREKKVKAFYFFFLYTLTGSIFMFIAIIHIFLITGTTDYQILYNLNINFFYEKIYFLIFFLTFAIKIPIIPFHIWLPEAHVEAPTSGSILLAGILLKLGSYGLIRFLIPLFPKACIYFTPYILILCLISIIYSSLTAIRQLDLKKIIAYASIAHMNLIILGLFSLNIQGLEGSILQMISHGLISSGLFFSIGCLYDRYHTRFINYYGGLSQIMPLFSIFLFFYILSNISIPLSSNFVGELLILIGIFEENVIIFFFVIIGLFFGSIYSLLFYNKICYGNIKNIYLKIFYDLTYREFLINLIIIIPILLLGIYPKIFENYIYVTISKLIIHINYYLIYKPF